MRLRPPVLEVLPRCRQAVGRWEGRGPAGPMGAGMGPAPSTGSSSPHRLPSSPFGCRKPRGMAGASRTPLAQQRLDDPPGFPTSTLRMPRPVPPKSPGVAFCRMPAASRSYACCHSSGGTTNVFNRRKLTLQVNQVMLF